MVLNLFTGSPSSFINSQRHFGEQALRRVLLGVQYLSPAVNIDFRVHKIRDDPVVTHPSSTFFFLRVPSRHLLACLYVISFPDGPSQTSMKPELIGGRCESMAITIRLYRGLYCSSSLFLSFF